MSFEHLVRTGIAVFLMLCLGCAATPLEKNWGRSYEQARDDQVLNPDAKANLAPVEGFDGQAAENVMKGYREKSKGGKTCGTAQGGSGSTILLPVASGSGTP